MKKILTLFALIAVICTTQSIGNALTATKIDNQKDINKGTVNQISSQKSQKDILMEQKAKELTDRYYQNIKTCEPVHFDQYIDFFGFKMTLKADINGWVNNKCNYAITGKIGSLGKDIREVFELNLNDETVGKFEPKFECNFTKSDLETIVNAMIAISATDEEAVAQTLKSPEKKYTKKTADVKTSNNDLTKEEEKLIAIFTGGNACKLLNKEELTKQFTELMNSGDI